MMTRTVRTMTRTIALAIGLASTGEALTTTTYTTSSYDETSTSSDIAKSCKELAITLAVLQGKCNVADSDGDVTASEDEVDIEKYVYCTQGDNAFDGHPWYITYGKAPSSIEARPKGWRVDTDSVAERYEVWATCTENDGTEHSERVQRGVERGRCSAHDATTTSHTAPRRRVARGQ